MTDGFLNADSRNAYRESGAIEQNINLMAQLERGNITSGE
jgi:hypothetical protein